MKLIGTKFLHDNSLTSRSTKIGIYANCERVIKEGEDNLELQEKKYIY